MRILVLLSSVAMLAGLGDMPYGYYTLLRILVCLTGAVGFVAARGQRDERWSWAFGVIAVVYNPLLPLKLGSKPMWIALNAATLVCLWAGQAKVRR